VFDHVGIRVADRNASKTFYETVLAALGIERDSADEDDYDEWDDFAIGQAGPDRPATERLHLAFRAQSRDAVDAFWRVGVDAGYRDDGEPGLRTQYSPSYYGGFLLDPDGNSAEAVHLEDPKPSGNLDHLWIRVAELSRSRPFYELVGRHAGFSLATDRPERAGFRRGGDGASFSLVEGPATANVHLAFTVPDDDGVHVFYEEATSAGHPGNGSPGERPEYHSGYFAAFVLDPDGNNVELVNHNR
jgi:catechol 2,3-dioxygenase-like lactoylglutathione lyase family enzyme